MGEVFLAHDEHLGHSVALKVLPRHTNQHSRELFRKEAHALSKLNHPNIVTVLDFDTQDELDFLVMEYVPGQALDDRVREGVVPEKELIDLGIQMAEGLGAAHQQGIVHRDLKPGNLRLTNDNRLKILDFGLARSTLNFSPVATTLSINGPADCSGTLPYMAPEQVLGQAADARTDIYSAGAVLYELCTGRPPFEQKLMTALVNDIIHQQPLPPSHGRSGLSSGIEKIILKCLEKDLDKRYQSATELVVDLSKLKNADRKSSAAWPRVASRFYVLSGCLLFLLILLLNYRSRSPVRGEHVQINSLAVLPLANLSGDPQQEYMADAITDFLITDLGQMNILDRVISRTSVLRYKTERKALQEIARQLNVDALIEGSVVRSADRVQVTVRLMSGQEERQLWSHSYQSEFRDLLGLEHELAFAVATELKSGIAPKEKRSMHADRPVSPAAQEAYLRGRFLQFGTSEQIPKARQYFEDALRIDPGYAPAYAGLADTYWNDIGMRSQDSMPKARDYALKAIALDDSLAHAHTALATVYFYGDWDWSAADREYQRALQLNPNDAESHRMYSVFLTAMGRTDEALAQVSAAQQLDPLYGVSTTAGWDLYCARRYDQALEYCQKAVDMAPNDESSHACMSWAYLGAGRYQKAVDEAKQAWTLSGEQPVWAVLLGQAYAKNGNSVEAHSILEGLLKQSRTAYVPPTFIAALYTSLGDTERGFQWIDKAYAERDPYLAGIKTDPGFDSLRSDARFKDLAARLGLSR